MDSHKEVCVLLLTHLTSRKFYPLHDQGIFCYLALRYFNWSLRNHATMCPN
ncbi:unnamed protein product [Staurois parvus]|uniref:Uncharacterized protein n=1 Tax=Staurois parvus TaxID=386267 RepID=A0ABN9CJE2_9NEOB|nr:unnamed protein product [Staurois parvus]